ncbi:MAG: DUF4333 domain-containing protein [Kofleriaceae bacterium]
MRRLLLGLTLAVTACTAKAGGDQIEAKARELFKAQGLVVTKVDCPRSISVKVGTTFQCSVTFDNGEVFGLRGEVTSKAGKNFEYSLAPVEANYVTEKIGKIISDGLTEQVKITPTAVDCGAAGIHKAPATFSCKVTAPDGSTGQVDVEVDPQGSVNWHLVSDRAKPAPADGPAPDDDQPGADEPSHESPPE